MNERIHPVIAEMLQKIITDFAEKDSKASGTGRVFHAPKGHRRLTINLSEDLHLRLRYAAVKLDTTATDIISQLLDECLP